MKDKTTLNKPTLLSWHGNRESPKRDLWKGFPKLGSTGQRTVLL